MKGFVIDSSNIKQVVETRTFEAGTVVRGYWSDGKYFTAYPNKVCGETYQTTDKFGKPILAVRGTMEMVKAALPNVAPTFDNWLLTTDNATQNEVDESYKIAAAIEATEMAGEPPTTDGLDMLSFDTIRERYAADISDDEYRIWANYQKSRLFSLNTVNTPGNGWSQYTAPISPEQYLEYHDAGLVGYDGKEYVPAALYYSGDIYSRISNMEYRQGAIEQKIGVDRYRKQLAKLQAYTPTKLRLAAPDNERLVIKYIDPFWEGVEINGLSDGTIFEEPIAIQDVFRNWLDTLPKADFKNGSNAYNVKAYAIDNERFPKDTSTAEKVSTTRKAQQDLVLLFNRFTGEMLTRDDQIQIEVSWNRTYNNWVEIPFERLPVGFEINRWFKSGPIDPRKALWDGVRFMSANGSGVIAFDVGVGKTMTAILAVAQALYTGQCKRPLIIVPNPTYAKWIEETVGLWENGVCTVHGVLPQFKDRINDYYNLGVQHIDKVQNTPPQDYTITFMTYEALEKIGLSQALKEEIAAEMMTILLQGIDDRDAQKAREDIDKAMGNIDADTVVNIDDLGFDYVVLDEAHNMKKIFTKVKGAVEEETGKRKTSNYQITSGEPSMRGLKTFVLTQYILRRNHMRNVCLLTATPFTNSPLEIYSMLALVAYQELDKRGINNIKDFFDKFVNETTELVITTKNRFEMRGVIKSFNNRVVLQNIIFSYMLHKTGEEANVKRPVKVVYPRLKDDDGILLPPDLQVDTALPPTNEQAYWLRQIALFARGDGNDIEGKMGDHYFDPETDEVMGKDLLAVSLGRQCTISPLLLRVSDNKKAPVYLQGNGQFTAEELFASSPKLEYTLGCIQTIKKWHDSRKEPMSGVVIYLNGAVDYFPMIKDHLAAKLGLKPAQIETIGGGISQDKKERIKRKFLDGDVKILIGSSTIKEGIDLQNKSTTLFNLTLDWNPTDIQQLEGRIWRQGNQHSHVRIVTPMLENSIDIFMFQKLEEKTSRINSIWYRAGRTNVLDVEHFDPAELKLGLMTDPMEQAKVQQEKEVQLISLKLETGMENRQKLIDAKVTIERVNTSMQKFTQIYEESRQWVENQAKELDLSITLADMSRPAFDKSEKKTKEKEQAVKRLARLQDILQKEQDIKVMMTIVKMRARHNISQERPYSYTWSQQNRIISDVEILDREIKSLERLQKNVLTPHNLTLQDDFQPLISELEVQIQKDTEEKLRVSSEDRLNELASEFQQKREEAQKFSRPVDGRVEEFTKHNHLLSCLADLHDCSLDDAVIKRIGGGKVADMKPASPEKNRRLRIAKARAKALRLKLTLLKAA